MYHDMTIYRYIVASLIASGLFSRVTFKSIYAFQMENFTNHHRSSGVLSYLINHFSKRFEDKVATNSTLFMKFIKSFNLVEPTVQFLAYCMNIILDNSHVIIFGI